MSRGMTSEVWALRDDTGKAVYTGWFRKLIGSGRVIYTEVGWHPEMSTEIRTGRARLWTRNGVQPRLRTDPGCGLTWH